MGAAGRRECRLLGMALAARADVTCGWNPSSPDTGPGARHARPPWRMGLLWEGVVTCIHKMETAPTVAALGTTRNSARLFHVADRLTPRRINLWASRLLGRLMERMLLFPFSIYSAPGGLRQGPGYAAESLTVAITSGNGSTE